MAAARAAASRKICQAMFSAVIRPPQAVMAEESQARAVSKREALEALVLAHVLLFDAVLEVIFFVDLDQQPIGGF